MRAVGVAFVLAAATATAAPAPGVLGLRVARANGTVAALHDVIGDRPTVVAFWATYCPPCRAEVPALNNAAERWRDRGLRVLGVAMEPASKRVRAARRTWDMRYDVVTIAPGQDELLGKLFPHGLPASAFVAHGAALFHEGFADAATIERLVSPLLEAAAPPR